MKDKALLHGASKRIGGLTQSYIRKMTYECNRFNGINLGQGICDLPTPPEILEATSAAILADKSVYSPLAGIDELRAQIAKKARNYNKISQAQSENVIVTIGSTGAFNSVVQSLFDPGDEFILFEPYYGYHLNTLKVGGLIPKFVSMGLDEDRNWTITREQLEAVVTEKTKGIMCCTPSNPSGKILSRPELEMIADFCQEHDLLAVTDEIYEYIVYSGSEHISLASIPGMWDRTITMSGFSKTFSITGWRLGFIVAPTHLTTPIGLINDLFYVCAPTPLQYGIAAGMAALDDDYYSKMSADYEKKRDLFCGVLTDIGLRPHIPNGAYYVLANIERLGLEDDKKAAMHILESVGVASVPGSSFFMSDIGKTLTRFCYAKEWDVLEKACEQLSKLA